MGGSYEPLLRACRRALWALLPQHFLIDRWLELALLASAYTLLLLLFMKFFGFPGRVREARREMLRHVYEVVLYRRSPRAVVRAEARLVLANAKLLVLLAPTILFGAALAAAGYDVVSDRYRCPPVPVGEAFVVRAQRREAGPPPVVATPGGSTPAGPVVRVRSPAERTMWARMSAPAPGLVALEVDGRPGPSVNVARSGEPVRRWQYAGDVELYVDYPAAHRPRGVRAWVWFLAVCLVGAIPLSRLLGLRL